MTQRRQGVIELIVCSLMLLLTSYAAQRLLSRDRPAQIHLPAPLLSNQLVPVVERMGSPRLLNGSYARPRSPVTPPGDTFASVFDGEEAPGAPVITSYTRNASPGRSVVITGARFTAISAGRAGADTRIRLYGQTQADNAVLREVAATSKSSGRVTFVVPEDVHYGLYLVWIENEAGASRPVRLNATEAWWAGPDPAVRGQQISIYGRNLSARNGNTDSHIVIRPWASGDSTASVALDIDAVTPYRVRCRIPESLDTGKYEIWVHNGHGGEYGWSGPLPLTIKEAAASWPRPRIDVTGFGASGAEAGDDTNSVERALGAAASGQTVYFPAGHYRISRPLAVPSAVSIEGESADKSTVEFVNGSGRAGSALRIHGFPSRLRNLTIKGTITGGLPHETALVRFDGRFRPTPDGVFVENVRCYTSANQLYSCFSIEYVNGVSIRNNHFESPSGVLIKRCHQVFIEENVFAGTWPDVAYSPLAAIGASVSKNVNVSKNRAYSQDRTLGRTLSRFMVVQGHSHGAASNYHVAGNDIAQVGCSHETCGENILIEAPGALFSGTPAEVDGLTLRFDHVDWPENRFDWDDPTAFEPPESRHPSILIIQSGAGEGQYRNIVKTTTNSITIDYPWDAPPDRNSIVAIVTASLRNAIVENVINGWAGALENRHTTNVGIQSYGSLLDSVIRGNVVSTLNRGIEISSLTNSSCGQYIAGRPTGATGNNCPTWNNIIEFNTITKTQYGVASWTRVEAPSRDIAGPAMIGNIIRENFVGQSVRAAITLGDINKYHKPDSWQFNTVVEHNWTKDAPAHVELLGLQAEPHIRANVLSDDNPGSVGVRIERHVETPYICHNNFVGPFLAPILFSPEASALETNCQPEQDGGTSR